MRPEARERAPWTKTLRLSEPTNGSSVVDLDRAPRIEASPVLRQYRRLNLWMALTDAAALVLGLLVTELLRVGLLVPATDGLMLLLLAAVLTVPVFAAFRLYSTFQLAPADEFRRIIQAVTVVVLATFTLAFWSPGTSNRAWIGLGWLLTVGGTLAIRRFWHWWVWRARQEGRFSFRTLVVGSSDQGQRLAEVLHRDPLGFHPIGFVSAESGRDLNGHSSMAPRLDETDLPLLGSIRDLREIVRQTAAECLFVSSTEIGLGGMAYVTELARLERLELRATSNFPEVLAHRLAVQPVGGVMALSLKPASLTAPQALAKRIFDLVVGSAALIVSLPLWLGIALAIRLTSRGPILFRQERVGVRGQPFMLFKFRTMVANAEELLPDLKDRNEAGGPLFKLREDPRITKVGGWLRRRSLDELPQLLNVLRGDMSLVGPRPCLPEEVVQYDARALERLDVPPGVTGLWQVQGRSNASFDEYVRLDVFYVENWSLAYDLYILLKTVRAVLSRDGAY